MMFIPSPQPDAYYNGVPANLFVDGLLKLGYAEGSKEKRVRSGTSLL